MKSKNNYTVRVNGVRWESRSLRRFYTKTGTIKFGNLMEKVYVRVSYGDGTWNDGEYIDKHEFTLAVKAFTEL